MTACKDWGNASPRWPVRVHAATSTRRVSPDHLRLLSEGAQEGAAHAVAIGKARLPGDDIDRIGVSRSDGWHVVTTVDTAMEQNGDAEKHAVVRFSLVLLPGLSPL
jgi:hypothetical protein